jgi:hypothetical protein
MDPGLTPTSLANAIRGIRNRSRSERIDCGVSGRPGPADTPVRSARAFRRVKRRSTPVMIRR